MALRYVLDEHLRGPLWRAIQQHNATGVLVSEKVENGRRITEWRSDSPVRAFNVVLGRWKVKRGDGVAVYYDARHPYNVDEMLEALVAARRWYGEWFAPYPWKELKLSEFPGLASYAQGSPTNITFSENIGFLTRSEPKANDAHAFLPSPGSGVPTRIEVLPSPWRPSSISWWARPISSNGSTRVMHGSIAPARTRSL